MHPANGNTLLTPDTELELVFDPCEIPSHMHTAHLAANHLHLRPLSSTDDSRGFIAALSDLTHAPTLSRSTYLETFKTMKACPNTYYPLVLIDTTTDKVVGSAMLMMERKFIRNAGLVGHVEDVVIVSGDMTRGKGLGRVIIDVLTKIGMEKGCYKVILDCGETNVAFYEKCGYFRKGSQMAFYSANVPAKSRS